MLKHKLAAIPEFSLAILLQAAGPSLDRSRIEHRQCDIDVAKWITRVHLLERHTAGGLCLGRHAPGGCHRRSPEYRDPVFAHGRLLLRSEDRRVGKEWVS